MKIVVTGLRGFPDIQGGVETHCEELFPRLAALGCDVTVVRRKNFVHESPVRKEYRGVKFKDLTAWKVSGLEAALHTMKAIFYARAVHADIIHIQAIGPSVMVPLAKLLGLKVVVTHHGPDYDREKWGAFAKAVLRLGEYFAAKMADEIVVISTVIDGILKTKYHRNDAHLIFNGVNRPVMPASSQYIDSLGVKRGGYLLAVGRFVEEKGFDKLIEAYLQIPHGDLKLVIAGDADHESPFSQHLKQMAAQHGVVLTGMIKGEKLAEVYANAALFVLPSSHEGLPFTLLEAMSYGLKTVVSDIPALTAMHLPAKCYYHLYDAEDLKAHIQAALADPEKPHYDLTPYDWDHIARQYLSVYQEISGASR